MNELEIKEFLTADKYTSKYFKGVIAYDQLSNGVETPGLYVVNTDVATGPGIHWVCLFLSVQNEYFDSLGLGPKEVKDFLEDQNKPYLFSTKRLQAANSDVCGDYCILYAYFRCRGWSLKHFLNLFSDNLHENDVNVQL